jgi:hypothetical protein
MASDYAFIRAYGKFVGQRESKTDETIRRARTENAPDNVLRFDTEANRWIKFNELEEKAAAGDAEAANQIKQIRAIMRNS